MLFAGPVVECPNRGWNKNWRSMVSVTLKITSALWQFGKTSASVWNQPESLRASIRSVFFQSSSMRDQPSQNALVKESYQSLLFFCCLSFPLSSWSRRWNVPAATDTALVARNGIVLEIPLGAGILRGKVLWNLNLPRHWLLAIFSLNSTVLSLCVSPWFSTSDTSYLQFEVTSDGWYTYLGISQEKRVKRALTETKFLAPSEQCRFRFTFFWPPDLC